MRVVEDHPGVMVLAGVSALAHIEPSNALRQHQNRGERGGRHHLGDTFSSDPLKAHQQRELALHGCCQGQGVPQKVEHRPSMISGPTAGQHNLRCRSRT